MNVCVVALGKIGLPLAVQIAAKGHRVHGADVDPALVACVNRGAEPFPGEEGLAGALRSVVADGRLTATEDTSEAVRNSDAVVVVVPLAVDGHARPDFTRLDAATAAVGRGLRPGVLVSFETTLPVGTTRRRLAPALAAGSGLAVGRDFHVCFSPERVSSGRVFADLRRYPKLVGGIDVASTARAVGFYSAVLDFDPRPDLDRPNRVWDLGSAEAAELAKLVETTYRDVNIALANEFARFADRAGLDVHTVIEAANSQPFSHVHRPGIAVGGHCIPVYPQLYLSTDPGAAMPAAGRAVNDAMPAYAVERLAKLISLLAGCRVAVLGAAYRGGVKETAFSGVFPLVAALKERGALAFVHDPLYSERELTALGLSPYRFGEHCDAVVVQADHQVYSRIGPADCPGVRAVVNGRACLDGSRWTHVPGCLIGAPALRSSPAPHQPPVVPPEDL